MQDLFSLLVFVIFIGASIFQSIAQSKKKREQELEEAMAEPEKDFEEPDAPTKEVAPPRPLPESQPLPKTTGKLEGWEDLKRQLEQALGTPPPTPKKVPAPPPPRPTPAARVPDSVASSSETRKAPARQKRWQIPKPRQERPQPAVSPAPAPKPVPRPKKRPKPQPAVAIRKRIPRTTSRKNPFDIHPNPVANAVILSEILRPHQPNSLAVHRPTSPSR